MNAPTLLIGLGGTGSKIIARVSKMVTQEQRNNIAFAVFDTDINELKEIKDENPFVYTIQTSTRQTVGEYLQQDTHARDTWFPINAILNGKALTEGAGQVRAISRLALETVIRTGKMEPLHEAIKSLYKVEEDKAEQALRIIIVSSLAGGTGSGLILPAALYTRNYLETHFRSGTNITRGFFILPEVFYEVIKSQSERNNLKVNAYATLRELDAFLMKADETLPEKYKPFVNMQFPRVASNGYEEYKVRPYDFCFLFDAQNAEGSKLNSFDQYLDHAANCIYAQSIGPMNKRSNSSEDNTIRKLAKERGRNRYAGAGASMLVYPVEDIKKLVALKWAKQGVSNQWMKYDALYKELRKENEKKANKGIPVKEQKLSVFYANQVESSAKHDDSFAMALIKSTGRYSNGVTRTANMWDEYVNSISKKIEENLLTGDPELAYKHDDANDLISSLGVDYDEYGAAFDAAEEYRLLSNIYAEEVAHTISYALFKSSNSLAQEGSKDYKLETYLTSLEGNFLHPNAIRYLLIKIADLMSRTKEFYDNDKKDLLEVLYSAPNDIFNDPNTEEDETQDEIGDRRQTFINNKLMKRLNPDQEDMKKKLRNFVKSIEEYQVLSVQSFVFAEGIKYIESIIEAFEKFYSSFELKVETIDSSIKQIYKNYSGSKGTTLKYVCASENCLNMICEKRAYQGGTTTIDANLAKEIYKSVRSYAQKDEKPNSNNYFNSLFDDGIIGYFTKLLMDSAESEIDLNIIQAIERECEYEAEAAAKKENVEFGGLTDECINKYVHKVIEDTRKLSCPFIESPLGELNYPIYSCTFSKSLKPAQGDETPTAQLIRNELMNLGGAPDEDITKNMIMFYQSFYGLRANQLSKFAPPEKSPTHDRSAGEYFKAYYELVAGINPRLDHSKEISPHIDKWWHLVKKMPDLDEENEQRQEYDIYAAFFWAVLNRYVYLLEEGEESVVYKLDNVELEMDDDCLVVSNGTQCDKLYEVLDAIAIYPELVDSILNEVEVLTKDDLYENVDLEDGVLCRTLKRFKIEEPRIGKKGVRATNIFDIPMLLKKSATPDTYYEAQVLDILKVELSEIKKYLLTFYASKDLPEVMGKIIKEQFELHLASVELESVKQPKIYKESLFKKSCDIIIKELSNLGLKRDARAMKEQVQDLMDKE